MVLSDQLKEMRERKGIPQRIVAATLDIDTAIYCKMEKGALKPKRNHIPLLTSLFEVNEEQLLKFRQYILEAYQEENDFYEIIPQNITKEEFVERYFKKPIGKIYQTKDEKLILALKKGRNCEIIGDLYFLFKYPLQ